MSYNFGDPEDILDLSIINKIKPSTLMAIERYVLRGADVGDFMTAVIENNLREAIGRADYENLAAIQQIVQLFYNYCPGNCWGSKENRLAWQKHHGLENKE